MTARILRILDEAERILRKHSPERRQQQQQPTVEPPVATRKSPKFIAAAEWAAVFKQYEPPDGYKAALDAMKDKK